MKMRALLLACAMLAGLRISGGGRATVSVAGRPAAPIGADFVAGEPFVLRDGAGHWAAVEKWTPRYFAENFPGVGDVRAVRIPLDDEVRGVTPYLREYSSHMDTLSFSDACPLAYDNNVSSHYVYQVRAVALLNESQYLSGNILRHDINFGELSQFSRPADERSSHFPWHPPLSLDRYFEDAYLWIGSNNTRSGLHFDTSDNFHAILSGSKTVVLFPPDDAPYLYPFPDVPIQSQIDPLYANVADEFPLVTKTSPRAVILRPGDVLFIPQYWWHFVKSNSVTVSVNRWHSENTPTALPTKWPRPWEFRNDRLKRRRRRQPTESLDSFRYIGMNPRMLKQFYMGAGAPAVCRAWYSLAHGFVQYVRVLEESDREIQQTPRFRQDELQRQTVQWQRVGTPRITLFGYGAEIAKRALDKKLVNLMTKGSSDVCAKEDVTAFRRAFRKEIVGPLLLRLDIEHHAERADSELTEDELEGMLVSSHKLFRRMAKGCLSEDLFATRGGGATWAHCEKPITAQATAKRKEVGAESEGEGRGNLEGSEENFDRNSAGAGLSPEL